MADQLCRCGEPLVRRGSRGPLPKHCSSRCRDRAWRGADACAPRRESRPRLPPATLIQRIERHTVVEGDCWLWAGSCSSRGHGQITVQRRPRSVRRVLYELLVGPIGEGQLRSTCGERACVNPEHMRRATPHHTGSRSGRRRELLAAMSLEDREDTAAYREVLLRDPCSYCGGDSDCVDHIDAIAAGGSVHWSNTTAACAVCNGEKFTAPLLRALRNRGGASMGTAIA